ncbi:probable ubiquitin carboxyl-terminal hydrolase 16 [Daphnia pulex]|uniref:probable ubiquitin carboxyl-terminal hydrolase 16 n=1 Tax=Daphnia pulex TaxID=6669 RepID=UPI001EE0946A|nr:probable ubiquitin carboxyl-terminal hydrolase 16 [Daphnia pulex]
MQRMVIWPLPMTRRGYTLDDCLTNYLADADMSDRECFRCGNREAVMKRTVVSWPRVFVICLQRFSNGAKDEAPICFSEIWQPREKDVEPDREYILQAVVTHLGQTIECGHYVCQCRGSDGVIRSFNDDRVTSKLWDEYAAEAYLLFFVEQ